jgi:hypothetical protein
MLGALQEVGKNTCQYGISKGLIQGIFLEAHRAHCSFGDHGSI